MAKYERVATDSEALEGEVRRMDGTGSLPSTPLTRAVRLFLLVLVLAAVCAVSLQPDTQADHEHLVALSHADAAVQPLIRHRRALVVLQAEPRFTQNMAELSSRFHSESNGQQKRPHVQVSLQVAGRLGSWILVGSPWTIPLSSDFMRWRSLQRHHPGKGLEDFSWHSHTFELGQHANAAAPARLSLTTNLPKPISLLLRVQELSPLGQLRNLFAMCVVLLVFGLIASEAVHRTVAAGVGCSLVLGLMALLGERPTVHQIGGWVDLDTVCLLFGMMLLVGYLSRTGVFEWSAARLFSRFGASPPTLVTALCLATALVSAFLDNVTTILLVTPVTVSLCRMLQLPPARVVICTVLCSNIGGAATIIGDPPNIMIGSQLAGQGVTFTRFAAHLAPAVLMCLAGAMLYILHALRPSLSPESKNKKESSEAAALSESGLVSGATPWPTTASGSSSPPTLFARRAAEICARYPIREAALLKRSAPVLCMVAVCFCLSSTLRLPLAAVPLFAAICLALLDPSQAFEPTLSSVEWSTLLFFGALSILMKGIKHVFSLSLNVAPPPLPYVQKIIQKSKPHSSLARFPF